MRACGERDGADRSAFASGRVPAHPPVFSGIWRPPIPGVAQSYPRWARPGHVAQADRVDEGGASEPLECGRWSGRQADGCGVTPTRRPLAGGRSRGVDAAANAPPAGSGPRSGACIPGGRVKLMTSSGGGRAGEALIEPLAPSPRGWDRKRPRTEISARAPAVLRNGDCLFLPSNGREPAPHVLSASEGDTPAAPFGWPVARTRLRARRALTRSCLASGSGTARSPS